MGGIKKVERSRQIQNPLKTPNGCRSDWGLRGGWRLSRMTAGFLAHLAGETHVSSRYLLSIYYRLDSLPGIGVTDVDSIPTLVELTSSVERDEEQNKKSTE